MIKKTNLFCLLVIIMTIINTFSILAQNIDIQPNILILDVTDKEFHKSAEDAGWSTGHLMFRETNVTSSRDNFWGEVQVYSKNGIALFATSVQVKTRAIAYGSLQLANYNRNNRDITPLVSFPVTSAVPDITIPDNNPIQLNLTKNEFSTRAQNAGWKTFHVMISSQSVTSINNVQAVPVFSADGHLLFHIAYPAADFIRNSGKLSLANFSNDHVSKLISLEID
jgi:hypothetical protein